MRLSLTQRRAFLLLGYTFGETGRSISVALVAAGATTLPKAPPTFRPHGLSQADQERQYDRDRGSARSRLYDAAWDRAAKAHLCEHPLCRYCLLDKRLTSATLVDHFWPHRGDRGLFWRREFWVSSCARCHSGMKQAVERAGAAALVALAARLGLPLKG